MADRSLITTGAIGAILAAICRATPLLAVVLGASGRGAGARGGADEAINIFGLAIRHGLTADDLRQTIFAYPTGASDIGDML
jgi:pyruvate/2-oxoglutarate dehydrogenase complex dihydrolipoamide dehydrogenase (E3) component